MITLFILSILFIIIASLVYTKKLDTFDTNISKRIISKRTPLKTKFMLFFTQLGTAKYVTLICISLFFFSKKGALLPEIVTIGCLLTIPVGIILKKIIKRVRPNISRLVEEPDHSFPSAHALAAATLYGGILLTYSHSNTLIFIAVFLLCLSLIFLIGYSRVYLGIHYLSDVLGGWILGFIISISVIFWITHI